MTAFKTVSKYDSRAFTCALMELVDEGMIDKDLLIQDLLGWLSESEVERFCRKNYRDDDNESIIRYEHEVVDEEDEDEDALNDFNYVGSRYHY